MVHLLFIWKTLDLNESFVEVSNLLINRSGGSGWTRSRRSDRPWRKRG